VGNGAGKEKPRPDRSGRGLEVAEAPQKAGSRREGGLAPSVGSAEDELARPPSGFRLILA
jgi:hypothetical protein